MPATAVQSPRRAQYRCGVKAGALGIALSLWLTQVRAETTFTPSIQLGVTAVDNLRLAPSGADAESELIGQVTPRIQFKQTSRRLVSAVDYSLQNLFYANDSSLNASNHRAEANGELTVFDDMLYIDGYGAYFQESVDPTQPNNFNNLLLTGNQIETAAGNLSPFFKHQLGASTAMFRYTRGVTRHYGVPELISDESALFVQDSEESAWAAAIGSTNRSDVFIWDIGGDSAATHYEVGPSYTYQRAHGGFEYRIYKSVWLTSVVGRETDLTQSISDGGLNSTYWTGGARWQPDAKNELELSYGHRFYGSALGARWTRTARFLTWSFSYTEDPTTDGQSTAITRFIPGEIATYQPRNTFSRRTIEPYLNKDLYAELRLTGVRTTVELHANRQLREYLLTQTTEEATELAATVRRAIGPTTELAVLLTYERGDLRDRGESQEVTYSLSLSRMLGRSLSASMIGTHLRRSGFTGYNANIATLLFTQTF